MKHRLGRFCGGRRERCPPYLLRLAHRSLLHPAPRDDDLGQGAAVKSVACATLLLGAATEPLSADDLSGPWAAIMQENDLVVRTDRHYTQGLKIAYLAGERAPEDAGWIARGADLLPSLGIKPEAYRYGLSLGQTIYTPTDITTRVLQTGDRPYAGLLQVSLLLPRRGQTARDTPVLDHMQLDLGVIGPESLAKQAQIPCIGCAISDWRWAGITN